MIFTEAISLYFQQLDFKQFNQLTSLLDIEIVVTRASSEINAKIETNTILPILIDTKLSNLEVASNADKTAIDELKRIKISHIEKQTYEQLHKHVSMFTRVRFDANSLF
jgi:hypothetical protein